MKKTAPLLFSTATIGALAGLALPIFGQETARPDMSKLRVIEFQNVVDKNDPTFNQELGINDFGVIAGYFGSGAAGHPNKGYTVFRRNSHVKQKDFINENFPGSVQTQVTGINNRGRSSLGFTVTVGFWADSNNASMVNNNFGFVNIGGQNGFFIDVNNPNTGTINGIKSNQLLGVNDENIAVGFYVDTAGATHGYTYSIDSNTYSANIDDPNGVGATTAAAINNLNQIVGFYVDGNNVTHGFFESNGAFKTIDGPNAKATSLLGLNNFGLAVGVETDQAGNMHGIVCDVYTGEIKEVDDPNGVGTTTFNGLNDVGQIVGFYVDGGNNTIGLLATLKK